MSDRGAEDPMVSNIPLRVVSLVLVLVSPAVLRAQTHVVPQSLAGVEGSSSSILPFGVDGPIRFMCMYDPSEFAFRGPLLMQGVAVRADHSTQPPQDQWPGKQTLFMSMFMSTTAKTVDSASTRFDDNHGPDRRVVLAGGRISLPPQGPLPTGPRPFDLWFPFDHPQYFDLTPVRLPGSRPQTLVIDFRIDLMPLGNYWVDTPLNCISDRIEFGGQGPRCTTSLANSPLTLAANESVQAGGVLTFTVEQVPRMGAFAVFVGSRQGGSWRGIPLPFDMTPIGAPDCYLNTEMLQVFTGVADTGGVGRITVPIPPGRQVVGNRVHAQATCFDLGANTLFFSMSKGLSITVCGPLAVARLWSRGQMRQPPQPPIPPADTGALTVGSALILELR